jgi:DJ-1/PfpI family
LRQHQGLALALTPSVAALQTLTLRSRRKRRALTLPLTQSNGQARRVSAQKSKVKDWNMAEHALKGLKVAILVTDGFEKVELTEPRKALDEAGAETRIVSPKADRVRTA